jgi:hypothetical protein
MSHLFLKDTFDNYSLISADIKTFCTYSIDGKFEKNFFKNDENTDHDQEKNYCKWSNLKSTATSLIKGRNTPLFMKFIFSLTPDILSEDAEIDEGVESLALTVRFDENALTVSSAVNRRNFSLDRSIDELWDKKAEKILLEAGLAFEEE